VWTPRFLTLRTAQYADYGGRSKIAEHVCGPKVSSACPADTDWSNMYGTMAKKVDDEALKVQKLPALSEQTLGAETLFGRRWLYDVNGPMLVELLEASEEGEIDVLAYYKVVRCTRTPVASLARRRADLLCVKAEVRVAADEPPRGLRF
jgi:hypothetical protein